MDIDAIESINYLDSEILYYAMIDIALNYISEAERNDLLPITNILSQLSEEMENALK